MNVAQSFLLFISCKSSAKGLNKIVGVTTSGMLGAMPRRLGVISGELRLFQRR